MSERKSIGNSTRFKVFNRDSFTCQYCGATPPSVVLEIDHIHPVSKGGKNHMDNLITACFSCNRGKAAGLLSDIPQSLVDKAAEIKEREKQLKGYTKILQAKSARISNEAWQIAEILEDAEWLDYYDKQDLLSIKRFLESLPFHELIDAAEIAAAKFRSSGSKRFRYFCGICWNRIREQSNG